MRFDKRFKPELCVSDDINRKLLHHVYFDAEKNRLVSTNGATLAVIPCTPSDEDAPGPALVHTEVIAAARKVAGRDPVVVFHLTGTGAAIPNGATYPTPYEAPRSFPPYERVLPTFKPDDEGTFTVRLNPKLLTQIANAIGAHGVDLTFNLKDLHDPIRVDPGSENGAFGILMPMNREPKK